MTLLLNMGTKPDGLEAKTYNAYTVVLGAYVVSMEDFLTLTEYVLTNTDLVDDDPRLKFVQRVKNYKSVAGWNSGQQRLGLPEEPSRYRSPKMIRPTRKNQKLWARKYLNDGKCPTAKDYYELGLNEADNAPPLTMLEWLAEAEPDITTLAEAWERCPRGDWLVYMLTRMQLDEKDLSKLKQLWELFSRTFVKLPHKLFPYFDRREEYFADLSYMRAIISATELYVLLQCNETIFPNADTNAQVASDRIREVFGNPWRGK